MTKKHRQMKHVEMSSPRVLGLGGINVMTYPMYANYGGMGFTQQATNGEENGETPSQEAAENSGAAPTSGSGEAAGTSAGAGSAGGM